MPLFDEPVEIGGKKLTFEEAPPETTASVAAKQWRKDMGPHPFRQSVLVGMFVVAGLLAWRIWPFWGPAVLSWFR